MPIDPSISLGVKMPEANQQANPLGMVATFAGLQNTLNQNRLFQQTFAARQKAGQILANAPDIDTGLAQLQKDPEVAAFAGEIGNTVRQYQLTTAEVEGKRQEQADSGFKAVVGGLAGAYKDPGQIMGLVEARLNTLSPSARERVAPAVQLLLKSMTDGLPADPQKASQMFNQRLAANFIAAGISPEAYKAIAGTPTTVDVGGAKYTGLQAPPALGGGFQPSTELGMTLAPTVATGPGSVPMPLGGGAGPVRQLGERQQAGGGTPTSPSPRQAAAPRPMPGATGPSAVTSPLAMNMPQTAGDGTPLLPKTGMHSPTVGTGAGGLPLLGPLQLKQGSALQEEFSGSQLKEYQNAVNSMGSFKYMDNAIDTMAKNGGFLVPGAFAQSRLGIAKAIQTAAQAAGIGDKLPKDWADKIATGEEFGKETTRAGLMVINQFLGGQREAAQVINGVTKSVPSIENSVLGAKLVAKSLEAFAQRTIDQRNFMNAWANQNQGNLIGATEAFNNLHPATAYAEGVLKNLGLTDKGFANAGAVKSAWQNGYITREMARSILTKNFGMK